MKLSELGEFGLIDRISSIISNSRHPEHNPWQQLLIGTGDDAAAWRADCSIQLATVDTLVEGTHFKSGATSWRELGWKAIAVNLSDIAAMGGIPGYALVSLALPGSLDVDCVDELYEGMTQIAGQFQTAITGGNIAYSEKTVITVTILGNVNGNDVLTRSAASPGDQIAVTGYLGLSAAGLRMLNHGLQFEAETSQLFRQAHLQPFPRVKEGQILLQQGVRAGIDISDGLIADLGHICRASKVGARVEGALIPVHPAVKERFKDDYLQLALAGGEDYELLFAAGHQAVVQVSQAIHCPVTVIGEITAGTPGQVTVVNPAGKVIPWQREGWDHFRSAS